MHRYYNQILNVYREQNEVMVKGIIPDSSPCDSVGGKELESQGEKIQTIMHNMQNLK